MTKERSEAGATPKPSLALTDGTMRLNGHLAAEIGMTPSILLLQIEWMIRHLDSAIFKDGKWWIEASARWISKKWFKGCITHETICRNLDKLEDQRLIIQEAGEKQGDKRLIALNPDGCATLESVTFEQREWPSENLTEGENTVTKPDGGRQKSRRGGVTNPDSEASENLTVPVTKSDAVLEETEDLKTKKTDSSEDHHQDARPREATTPDATPTPPDDDDDEMALILQKFDLLSENETTAKDRTVLAHYRATMGAAAVLDAIAKTALQEGVIYPRQYIARILDAAPPVRPGTSVPSSAGQSQIDHALKLKAQFEARFKPAGEGASV